MAPSLSLSDSSKVQVEELIKESVNSKRTPPFFFTAVSANGPLVSFNFGKDQNGNQISCDTVIRIHSMTKMVTSIAALQLVDRGLITLDTDVGEHLPGLAHPKVLQGFTEAGEPILVEAKNKVTLTLLLNHSSGLASEGDFPDLARYRKLKGLNHETEDDPKLYFDQPLVFEPGTRYTYSPSTDFVGKLIETLTGLSLEEYFQANIFKPLGMDSTSFLLTPNLASRLTLPIAWRDLSTSNIQPDIPSDAAFYTRYGAVPPASPPIQRGGGGLLSTTYDYTLLLTHLLRLSPNSPVPLPQGEKRLVSEDSWKKMFEGSFTDERAIEDLSIHKPGVHGPRSGDQQWSVGGLCLNLMDWEGRRKAGSGYWAGLSNILFFIDPVTGVAAMGGSQMFPVDDEIIEDVWAQAQKIVYAGLVENASN
ncbi:beta-lactamase/transpeptidase-like protein [Mrakia frigida]|uniref:serine hydrolase domain-containing protein n=1 Tax=Mrakia frigida TaxID=29902 RepID=UPI003FCC00A6